MKEHEQPSEPRTASRTTWRGIRTGCVLSAAVAIFAAGLIVLGGVAALGAAGEAGQVAQAWRSREWPNTGGTLLSASVSYQKESRGRFRSSPAGWVYSVRYSYTVAGRDYIGDRLRFHSGQEVFDSRQSAEAALGPLSPGQPVTVFYHPDRPAVPVLRNEFRLSIPHLSFTAIFAALTAGWIWWAFAIWRTWRNEGPR